MDRGTLVPGDLEPAHGGLGGPLPSHKEKLPHSDGGSEAEGRRKPSLPSSLWTPAGWPCGSLEEVRGEAQAACLILRLCCCVSLDPSEWV